MEGFATTNEGFATTMEGFATTNDGFEFFEGDYNGDMTTED